MNIEQPKNDFFKLAKMYFNENVCVYFQLNKFNLKVMDKILS